MSHRIMPSHSICLCEVTYTHTLLHTVYMKILVMCPLFSHVPLSLHFIIQARELSVFIMYTHSVDTLSKSLNLDNISKQRALKRTSVEIENQQFSILSKCMSIPRTL